MPDESDRVTRWRVKLAAKRDRKVLIGTKFRIGRQPRVSNPETWAEPGMVRFGLMRRTWSSWGFGNGTDGSGPQIAAEGATGKGGGYRP